MITGIWQKPFLEALSQTGNVREACKMASVTRQMAYTTRKSDPDFAKDWQEALESAADVLEREAWRRANDGTDKPVFYKGEECGKIREYSDLLLMFLLKGIRPEKFREKVYVSPAELDKLIEVEMTKLRGEEESAGSEAVN